MARIVSRAESFEKVYEAFSTVNFNSFDFATTKQSLLDYVRLYFPEDFNDYIESSEFIAILEIFAYVSELIAYRLDLNAHENFLSAAQRKESVLRLAKLVSYNPSRNIPARGLVRLTSITTSESIFDSNGRNLTNRKIIWSDPNNLDWKEQFLLIMNRVLEQPFGTVSPNERAQIDDVLFELYTLKNNPITTNGPTIFTYSVSVSGEGFPMELVPSTLVKVFDRTEIQEKRPEVNVPFTILYGSDGLGDSSPTTGFFCFSKQGTLQRQVATFDGVTPNQVLSVDVENINETDIFINNVDPNTQAIIATDPSDPSSSLDVGEQGRFGEWVEVDLAHAQNVIFNTNANRHKFEVETLDLDRARIIFGDGEFADIPSGTFHVWFRVSTNRDIFIPQNSIIEKSATFTYLDDNNNVQTLTFNFSAISSFLNNSASEDIEHVRRTAPAVYYTQDRMVNGRDYNTFMLQDPTILKLRALNRTFAGDSKYIAWHEPRENYDNVKIFGDDLALYFEERRPEDGTLVLVNTAVTANELIEDFIEPLLSSMDFFVVLSPIFQALELEPTQLRRIFNNDPLSFDPARLEVTEIANALSAPGVSVVDLYYSVKYDEWTVNAHQFDVDPTCPGGHPFCANFTSTALLFGGDGTAGSIFMIRITARYSGPTLSGWEIEHRSKRLVGHSENTRFWNTNSAERVIDFDSLNAVHDRFVLLQANINADLTGILSKTYNFDILGLELLEQQLPDAGLPDIHRLSIVPEDVNEDGVPDDFSMIEVFDYEKTGPIADFPAGTSVEGTIIIPGVRTILKIPNNRNFINGFQSVDTNTRGELDIEVFIDGVKASPGLTVIGIFTWDIPSEIADEELVNHIEILDGGSPAPFIFTHVISGVVTGLAGAGSFDLDVAEGDRTAIYTTGFTFRVDSSTGNDGVYTVRAPGSTFGAVTTIPVEEAVIDPTPDGFAINIEHQITFKLYDFVYFSRATVVDRYIPTATTNQIKILWATDDTPIESDRRFKRNPGRYGFNFAWFHFTSRFHLVDPAATNIIDIFIITKGYFTALRRFLEGNLDIEPKPPTSLELRTSYADLIDNKMISDTLIMHPGKIKLLFGSHAPRELRASFKVIRPATLRTLTDNQVKVRIVEVIKNFLDINGWEFGETFYFSELVAAVHLDLGTEIDSVAIVPLFENTQFGDLFQVPAREDEILFADINTNNIEIVSGYTPENIRQLE